MFRQQILSDAMKLQTQPFAPEFFPGGAKAQRKILGRSLDPTRESRVMNFYFDLYDWRDSEYMHGLSLDDVLDEFPDVEDFVENDETLMVLISGVRNAGKRSLRNLILHKLQDVDPIIVHPKIDERHDHQSMMKDLAYGLIRDYSRVEKEPAHEALMVEYNRLNDDPGRYTSVFDSLRVAIRDDARCKRPIVLMPKGVEYHESWQVIHEAVSGIATLIVIIASDRTDAEACAATLRRSASVVHIHACELNFEKGRKFVRDRLALLRTGAAANDVGDMSPFSDEALVTLFKKGSQPDANNIEFPIGEINETLALVMDHHLTELEKRLARGGLTVDQLNAEALLIRGDDIREVRKSMNTGKRARRDD